jgi:SAM-dependent methyltransferase
MPLKRLLTSAASNTGAIPLPPCRLCGSLRSVVHLYGLPETDFHPWPTVALQIFRCQRCGVVFSDYELGDGDIREFYGAAYWDGWLGRGLRRDVDGPDEGFKLRTYRSALDMMKEVKPCGRLLDVGCGLGDFMVLAAREGYEVYGVDVSEYAAQMVRDSFADQVQVFTGELAEANYPDGSFDIVTAWDLIEHLPKPKEFLAEVRRILRGDGLFVLRTPNQNSLYHLVADVAYRLGFSLPVTKLYHIDHLFYFSDRALLELLAVCGFTVYRTVPDDRTPDDPDFRGWQKAILLALRFVALRLKKHHAIIQFAKPEAGVRG